MKLTNFNKNRINLPPKKQKNLSKIKRKKNKKNKSQNKKISSKL